MTEQLLRYDTAPERRAHILDTVRTCGFASIVELAERLGVSDMTVRRDLRKLQNTGQVNVVRGGVHLPPGTGFEGRRTDNATAKHAIAAAATELLAPNDSIALDAGTTTCILAESLPAWFTGSVVTHSVPALQHFLTKGAIRVVSLGGDLYPASEAFVGPMTVEAAAQLRVRTLFLGAAAIDERGVYVASDIERPTKLALIETADRVVLLADHTKFTASAPVLLCPPSRLHSLVTDREPEADLARSLAKYHVRVVLGKTQ